MNRPPGGESDRRPGAPSFHGLGRKSRQWLAAIGIGTPEQLAARDPFEVYARLKAAQPAVSVGS